MSEFSSKHHCLLHTWRSYCLWTIYLIYVLKLPLFNVFLWDNGPDFPLSCVDILSRPGRLNLGHHNPREVPLSLDYSVMRLNQSPRPGYSQSEDMSSSFAAEEQTSYAASPGHCPGPSWSHWGNQGSQSCKATRNKPYLFQLLKARPRLQYSVWAMT